MGMIMSPAMAATGQYFNKNRGAAMGLAVAGSSLGGVVWPIALGKMLYNPHMSFGWTVRITGFVMLALTVPSCLAIRARLPPRAGRFFLPEAFKNPRFLGVVGSVFLIMLGSFLPFFYLPSLAVEHGMSAELSSYLLAILNAASFFGRVIPGVLGDKVGRYNTLCAAGISSGILILCMQALSSNASIIVFAALYGFTSGAIVSGMSVLMAGVPKDPREIGTYMGMGMATVAFGALIGPPIDGAFLSRYGGFNEVSIFSGIMTVAGSVAAFLAKATTEKGLFGTV
jgi:MFS family permease